MKISRRSEDGIMKIFFDNRYAGYVDEEGDLYAFYDSIAILVRKNVEMSKAAALLMGHMYHDKRRVRNV